MPVRRCANIQSPCAGGTPQSRLDQHFLLPIQDAGPGTPIFVFLSPGVDVAASVEALGRKLGFTSDNGRYATVSLGQACALPS
jgi:hypothetical protein